MRWRLLDSVQEWQPWQWVRARKAVSFEELLLLEPMGRDGVLPESLLLGSCAEVVSWLVAASSELELAAVLDGVERLEMEHEAVGGRVLEVTARITGWRNGALRATCAVTDPDGEVARGELSFALVSLAEGFDTDQVRGWWESLRGTA